MKHGCNVNACIISYNTCVVANLKISFIIPHGVGMRFSDCWQVLKHLIANEIIIKLYLSQVLECLFHFHYSQSNMLVLVENFQQ